MVAVCTEETQADRSFRTKLNDLRRLLGKKVLFGLFIVVLATLSLSAIELLIAFLVQVLLKAIGAIEATPNIRGYTLPFELSAGSVCVIFVVVSFVRAFIQFCSNYFRYFTCEYFQARVRQICAYDLLKGDRRKAFPISQVLLLFSGVGAESASFVLFTCEALNKGVLLLCLVTAMLWVAPYETIVGFLVLFLVFLVNYYFSKKIVEHSRAKNEERQSLSENLIRVGKNWLFLKLTRYHDEEYRSVVSNIRTTTHHVLQSHFLSHLTTNATTFLGSFAVVAVIYYSHTVGNTSPLLLVSFLYLFARFIQVLSLCSNIVTQLSAMYSSFTIVSEYTRTLSDKELAQAVALIDEKNEVSSAKGRFDEGLPDKQVAPSEIQSIYAKNVDFSYEAGQPVLEDLSFAIEGGQIFGICGPSGCGKSTLLLLILGFLRADDGEILVNEMDPHAFFENPKVRIGYVGPEPFLRKGSIRENVLYGTKKAFSDEEIMAALTAANLDAMVRSIPSGLDFQISEGGEGLSAGQKQRLCLARSLLTRPHVLVLDEVSANLDETTEHEIAKSIAKLKGKTTVIIVSHRPGILEYADQILRLRHVVDERERSRAVA